MEMNDRDEVLLASGKNLQLLSGWSPKGQKIVLASSSPSQIIVSCGQNNVVYLEMSQTGLKESWTYSTDDEVSCLDITPISEDPITAKLAAAGIWNGSVLLLNVVTRVVVLNIQASTHTIPRSILFSIFENNRYLLVAMGDGRLISYEIDDKSSRLSDERRVSIGTKPVKLSRFRSKGNFHVFAASDRPMVIYGEQKKLMFSNLNEQNVNFLTSFHTVNAPECLAMAKDDLLMIGNIDDIQKLHIKSIYLQEMPRRICHQPETHSFGVLVESYRPDGRPQSYFRIFDDETFERKANDEFQFTETGTSILSMNLPERQDGLGNAPFFIVGTAFVLATENEPCRGRMLVYSYTDNSGHPALTLVAEKEFKGAVFSLKPIQEHILATVNNRVFIVEWKIMDNGTKQIAIRCTQHGHILAVYSDVRDNFVLIGDLMRSISLLIYDQESATLNSRAKDPSSNWMTAVKILDDEVFLGAENSYNLFTSRKISTGIGEEEERLEPIGQYHLGEYVNAFREGSLVATTNLDSFLRPPVLFGTINGQIGMVLSLPKEKFEFLDRLQTAMEKVVRPLGMFDHRDYRRFWNERQSKETKNFIDGDLIEQFLDLRKDEMIDVSEQMETSVDDVYKIVEDLSKLH